MEDRAARAAHAGRLDLGGGWDPRLIRALSRVTGQFAAARFHDGDEHGLALAYAGVRLLEREGRDARARQDDELEFERAVEAASGLDDEPQAEIVAVVPGPKPFAPLPELARSLHAEVLAVHVADGGAVRWRHVGGGHDEAGGGHGWRDLAAAWARLAPEHAPREIRWPRV